jgi:hypothetical protein
MSDDAKHEIESQKRRNLITAILTSVLATVLGGLMLYTVAIVIAQPEQPEVVAYVTSNEDAPPNDTPVTPERVTSRPSASVQNQASVITSDAVSDVAIASVDVDVPVMADLGQSVDLGVDFGAGIGDDLGSEGAGYGSDKPGGSALEGTFYDLKQTQTGAPGVKSDQEYIQVVHDYVKSFNPSLLSKYYKSATKLYASQFYIPNSSSTDAPKAYKCAEKVKAGRWLAIYRGKITAPKSGKFRFVGAADDVLVVRFNNQLVFDYGWASATLGKTMVVGDAWINALQAKKGASEANIKLLKAAGVNVPPVTLYKYGNTEHWNKNIGGYAAGQTFEVKSGKVYPIEIVLGDTAGQFGESLMIEEVGATPEKKDSKYGAPILPLFRTNYALPDPKSIKGQVAPFDPIGIVWPAVK